MLTSYLLELATAGIRTASLADVRTSISMACVEASDKRFQPGTSFTVSRFFEDRRRNQPVRRRGTGDYMDPARLLQEVWLYGPSDAMTLGHKKERLAVLLHVDAGVRPSDLTRLFRVFSGWQRQIEFFSGGVRLRFFYTKEVVPGSARSNSTGYWFSKWVTISATTPTAISTPECLRDFLDGTSGADFAVQHVPQLDATVQPLFYGQRRQHKFQPASVDHVSNMVKRTMDSAGMVGMHTKSLRGASPSKVVQLFPDMLEEALQLGRWTSELTFRNHYQAPVKLLSRAAPPETLRSNVQQLLRWGFRPRPPRHVSATDYMRGPTFWVGQTFPRLGLVESFNEGVYVVKQRNVERQLWHYQLMKAISDARSAE